MKKIALLIISGLLLLIVFDARSKDCTGSIRVYNGTHMSTSGCTEYYGISYCSELRMMAIFNFIDGPGDSTDWYLDEEDLKRSAMLVGKVNLQKYSMIEDGMEAITKVRYKDKGAPGRLFNDADGKIKVEFDGEVKAIATGQSAVFYEGNDVIGGGIIYESLG